MLKRVMVPIGTVIVVALAGWVVAIVPATRTSSSVALRATGSEILSGVQEYAAVEIPRGVTVRVDGDLILRSAGAMVIEGELVRQSVSGTSNGASIRLEASERVVISGSIRAGDGVAANPDRPGKDGGDGGAIVVVAPLIQGGGTLRAGAGGWGGRAGRGGNGGTVELLGPTDTAGGMVLAIIGGDGGRGGDGVSGLTAGDGGDGGNAYAAGPINGANGPPGTDVTALCGSNGLNGFLCATGVGGGSGGLATGGNGGDGGAGIDGGNGGSGGPGGNATGGCGGKGGNGGTCLTGYTAGANGGNGGAATGGRGGNGGTGGSACAVGGPAGAGGAGGNGGSATGGNGGIGGDRGGSCPTTCPAKNGGNGGNGGIAMAGNGGNGGFGGAPLGIAGAQGQGGLAVGGTGGAGGSPSGTPGTNGAGNHGSVGLNGHSAGVCVDGCNNLYRFNGAAPGDKFGLSVSGAGDVTGDGYDDIIVGAPNNGAVGINAGRAYVYSGRTGTIVRTFSGVQAGDELGISVSSAGDLDHDGFSDVLMGGDYSDAGGTDAGKVWVYSGQYGLLLHSFTGALAGDHLGRSVADAGDVNNDGFEDIVFGAYMTNGGPGEAYVYSGQNWALLYTFTGEAPGDWFGMSVSGAGDVNGDGYSDVIVGARANDAGGTAAGRAYVYSGQTGMLLHTFTGEGIGNNFGIAVSGGSDVNLDGYDDLVVGAEGYNNSAGRAYVYSGYDGTLLHLFNGEAEADFLGSSVSIAGDVDGDGYSDIVVGARQNNPGYLTGFGRVYVYSGRTWALLHAFTGEATGDAFGLRAFFAGDVNSDGFDDIVVGACGNDTGGFDAGRAYVFLCPTYCSCPHQGDINGDAVIDVFDVIGVIEIAFSGGTDPQDAGCPRTRGDVDNNGVTDVFDLIYLIATAFSGGPNPVDPCGP